MDKAKVFVSYARKDATLQAELAEQLEVLAKCDLIECWDDSAIRAGDEWNPLILTSLEQADIILLLLTPAYVHSNYAWNIEMKRALERHKVAQAKVLPIIVEPIHWEDAPFAKLQVLPPGGAAITDAQDRRQAWAGIATEVAKIAKEEKADGKIRTDGVSGGQYVWIPAGTFVMGKEMPSTHVVFRLVRAAIGTESAGEAPAHSVTISKGFWMGRYPVTQGQWERVMRTNPSNRIGQEYPVESVKWTDCGRFFAQMSILNPSLVFRLPTEAEWEYASRAGSIEDLYGPKNDIAWWQGNSDFQTHPVGRKQPNSWGLYDTIGNVNEWCHDWSDDGLTDNPPIPYYKRSPAVDPTGPSRGLTKCIRGGYANTSELRLRVSFRDSQPPGMSSPFTGFRCVMQERE